MADFIQTFNLDEGLVDFINSNLIIEDDEKMTSIYADIPELHDPITGMMKEYLKQIEEYNYFVERDKLIFQIFMTINNVPSWTFRAWRSEHGKEFNFYIFLKDSEMMYEFFNPFVRTTQRFQVFKGLVILLPAIWVIVSRHTSTRSGNSVFIMGTTHITDLDDVHQAGSSNVITESTMSY